VSRLLTFCEGSSADRHVRSWLPDSSDIFVSVGADGSLRAFDLRTLEHSTILYESSGETPLARIAFSNREQYVAPFVESVSGTCLIRSSDTCWHALEWTSRKLLSWTCAVQVTPSPSY
jgi:WD40 repeat protein